MIVKSVQELYYSDSTTTWSVCPCLPVKMLLTLPVRVYRLTYVLSRGLDESGRRLAGVLCTTIPAKRLNTTKEDSETVACEVDG